MLRGDQGGGQPGQGTVNEAANINSEHRILCIVHIVPQLREGRRCTPRRAKQEYTEVNPGPVLVSVKVNARREKM